MRRMEKRGKRYSALLMNFRNITNTKDTISCVFIFTNSLNKNNYLNIAKTRGKERASRLRAAAGVLPAWAAHACMHALHHHAQRSQAVRSLGPLGCACYQACTCGLATSCSGWDLD